MVHAGINKQDEEKGVLPLIRDVWRSVCSGLPQRYFSSRLLPLQRPMPAVSEPLWIRRPRGSSFSAPVNTPSRSHTCAGPRSAFSARFRRPHRAGWSDPEAAANSRAKDRTR